MPDVGDRIRVQHDFNDREADGSYTVWLRPGTLVTMFDGDTTVLGRLREEGLFLRVEPIRHVPDHPGGVCTSKICNCTVECIHCHEPWPCPTQTSEGITDCEHVAAGLCNDCMKDAS